MGGMQGFGRNQTSTGDYIAGDGQRRRRLNKAAMRVQAAVAARSCSRPRCPRAVVRTERQSADVRVSSGLVGFYWARVALTSSPCPPCRWYFGQCVGIFFFLFNSKRGYPWETSIAAVSCVLPYRRIGRVQDAETAKLAISVMRRGKLV